MGLLLVWVLSGRSGLLVFNVVIFGFFLFLFSDYLREERSKFFIIIGGPGSQTSSGGSVMKILEHKDKIYQ